MSARRPSTSSRDVDESSPSRSEGAGFFGRWMWTRLSPVLPRMPRRSVTRTNPDTRKAGAPARASGLENVNPPTKRIARHDYRTARRLSMSIEAVAWALRQPVTDAVAKLIIISLADHHNASTGLCCPGRARLMEAGCCDQSTVKRKLAWLVKNGWIKVVPRHDANGRQTSNQYELKMAEKVGAQPAPLPPQNARGRGAHSAPRGAHSSAPPILKREQEPKRGFRSILKWEAVPEPSAEDRRRNWEMLQRLKGEIGVDSLARRGAA